MAAFGNCIFKDFSYKRDPLFPDMRSGLSVVLRSVFVSNDYIFALGSLQVGLSSGINRVRAESPKLSPCFLRGLFLPLAKND